MWYIGVDEAKSAHVKHCHELTDIVFGARVVRTLRCGTLGWRRRRVHM